MCWITLYLISGVIDVNTNNLNSISMQGNKICTVSTNGNATCFQIYQLKKIKLPQNTDACPNNVLFKIKRRIK